MAACVVWIDSEHAKIFKISATGIEKKEMKKHGAQHSNSHQDAHANHQEAHFFKEVSTALGHVEELLVFGPGTAKSHFKAHLESHHKSDILPHLVGVEALDKMSDNQILEASRKFFKKYNQFNINI